MSDDTNIVFRLEIAEQKIRHLEEREKDRDKIVWYSNLILAGLIFVFVELLLAVILWQRLFV